MTRRDWMIGSAALAGAVAAEAAAAKIVVLSSSNGARAGAKAMELLKSGADTLDAVVAGVSLSEEDPEDSSVGLGGLPNEQGVVELDASVMHGPTRRCGSVAGLRNIKTPSRVAKLVMEQTDHVMLSGDGALQFAKAFGFPEDNLLTEKSRLAWLVWKRSMRDESGNSNWTDGVDSPLGKSPSAGLKQLFPHVDDAALAWAWEMARHPATGALNCLALNAKGEMSGCTTTSGLAWRIPGRIGDAPVIGAGLFVDQEVGAAGSTGRGEESIRIVGAHTVVENMRHGMSPKDAVLDALKRIARNFDNDRNRLDRFDIQFYALRKDGEYAGGSLWNGFYRSGKFSPNKFVVNDGAASRPENCVFLFEKKA